jgi:hypothetical protein
MSPWLKIAATLFVAFCIAGFAWSSTIAAVIASRKNSEASSPGGQVADDTPLPKSSSAPTQDPAPSLPQAMTAYTINGTNYGNNGPYGTVINSGTPARRLMNRIVPIQFLLFGRIIPVKINANGSESEVAQLADDLWNATTQMKWDVYSKPNLAFTPGVVKHGIFIDSVATKSDQADPLLALHDWLISIGFAAEYAPGSPANVINVWPQ